MNYQEILDFWFDPKNQSWWFSQNDAFDALIEEKFKTIHQQAAHAELWSWRSSAEGVWLKLLCSTNCRETCIATVLWPLLRTLWPWL